MLNPMSVVLKLMLMPASLMKTEIKGEGHSTQLTFLSSSLASTHSAFPLTEVLTILKKFFSKDRLRRLKSRWMVKLRARCLLELTKKNMFFGVTFWMWMVNDLKSSRQSQIWLAYRRVDFPRYVYLPQVLIGSLDCPCPLWLGRVTRLWSPNCNSRYFHVYDPDLPQ